MHSFLGFMITCWGNCWNVGEKERKQAEKWRHLSAGRASLLPNEHCCTSAVATGFLAECVCLYCSLSMSVAWKGDFMFDDVYFSSCVNEACLSHAWHACIYCTHVCNTLKYDHEYAA